MDGRPDAWNGRERRPLMRLVCYISAHGFGHLSQTAPVLNALRRRRPDLELTLVSSLPPAKIRERVEGRFRLEARSTDFGFAMHDAFRIDFAASARAYRDFHACWDERVAAEAAWLATRRADRVLANVAYLPLAAAARLGIAACAMSSLDWSDLFAHAFGSEPWAEPIHAQIRAAYAGARCFIELTPAMPMPDLPNRRRVGPVAHLGQRRRRELGTLLGVPAGARLVAVMLGGIDTQLSLAGWPLPDDVHLLVPEAWCGAHARLHALEPLGWHVTDLIASVDALIGKPGYGTFVEAACNGTPMLYALREDWPEQQALVEWFAREARGIAISADSLRGGRFMPALRDLLDLPARKPPQPAGVEEAAALLAGMG